MYICRPRSAPKVDETAFPVTVGEVPLTVTLAMKACLTRDAAQRLTAAQMREVLADMLAEVASGTYVASTGVRMVRCAANCRSVANRSVHVLVKDSPCSCGRP